MPLDKQTILITGGNTGIGFEAAKALYESTSTYDIILGTRSISKGEAAISRLQQEVPKSESTVSVLQIDLTSDSSLEQAVETLKSQYGHVDALVNNAGAGFDALAQEGKMTTREACAASFDTNTIGPHILTELAAPLLLQSKNARVIFVSSGTSSLFNTLRSDTPGYRMINQAPPAGWPKETEALPTTAYRMSKTALNMVIRHWTRVFQNDGVKVWGLEPGFLATDFGGLGPEKLAALGAGPPSQGGQLIRSVIEGQRDADVGMIVDKDGIQPW